MASKKHSKRQSISNEKSTPVKTSVDESAKSVIARSDDGTIQITFTIPYEVIKKARMGTAEELGREIEVPGFRKGKAPIDKVINHIPQNTLLEKTLSKILPKHFSDAISEHKIKPAIYPKFELVKAQEGEDWQIRGVTCEIPEVNLGDYKKAIAGSSRAKKIWTPGNAKAQKDEKGEKEISKQEKEQEVMKILLDNIKVKVPKILVDEEVNSRLSRLLGRIEKLGLTLEGYLASINKTPQSIRGEYEEQARQGLTLDLTLTKIAEQEGIKIDKAQVDSAIKAASADPSLTEKLDTPEQRRVIESILKRRAVLDSLAKLL